MTSFEDRAAASERKFVLDAETLFRIRVRRNHLIGLWAAQLLGRGGEAAEAYAQGIVHLDFQKPPREIVLEHVAADLGDRASAAEISAKMEEFLLLAKMQLDDEAVL